MPTTVVLQDGLAELRMVIDRSNPVHAEAEAVFAAITKLRREAEIAENIATQSAEEAADCMAKRMMLGTAEAYDVTVNAPDLEIAPR